MSVPFGIHRRRVVVVDVVGHPVEVELADVADDLVGAVGQDRFNLHRLAAQVEVRLEVGDERVLLEHREPFGVGDRVRRNVEVLALPDARERNQVAALLRLLAFRIEPDADLGAGGDFFPGRVDVLIPRNLFAGQEQLARALAEQIVALADGPLHQLRPAIGQGVERCRASGDARRTGVHRFRIVVQDEIRDRMVEESSGPSDSSAGSRPSWPTAAR